MNSGRPIRTIRPLPRLRLPAGVAPRARRAAHLPRRRSRGRARPVPAAGGSAPGERPEINVQLRRTNHATSTMLLLDPLLLHLAVAGDLLRRRIDVLFLENSSPALRIGGGIGIEEGFVG